MSLLPLKDWIQRTRALVRTEHEEERREELELLRDAGSARLQELGLQLSRLEVDSIHTGVLGQTLISLKRRAGIPLPANSQFSQRDAVLLRWSGQNSPEARGVIHQIKDSQRLLVSFQVSESLDWSLQDEVESHSGDLTLLKVADEVTFQLYERTLERLEEYSEGRRPLQCSPLLEILHGRTPPTTPVPEIPFQPINQSLNPPQITAIRRALGSPELHLIHGPPGTGKTTTLVELILQAVQRGERVLACAPSNIAVDNIVEGLAKYSQLPLQRRRSDQSSSTGGSASEDVIDDSPIKICRVGHPARLMTSILEHSLDAVIRRSDDARIISDIRKEIDAVRTALFSRRGKRGSPTASASLPADLKDLGPAQLKQRLRELRKDLRSRSRAVATNAIADCDVVLSTLTGVDRVESQKKFDLVVIDEAAQAVEVACYIPLCVSGSRLVLAGDHQQLPPVVKSEKAKELAETLFARVHAVYPDLASMLTLQYRMHERIMEWSSQRFYGGKLEADSSVAEHLLQDLPTPVLLETRRISAGEESEVQETEWDAPVRSSETVWGAPLWFWDTVGCGMWEQSAEKSGAGPTDMSHSNPSEAEIVLKHLQALIQGGLPQEDIAVISPYAGQVRLLKQIASAYPRVEIGTVDGFQGREKEAIIMSFVRSNDDAEIGFLKDSRRTNVAVTRARRHLALIGDSGTLCSDETLDSLVEFASEHGEYRSAQELQPQAVEADQVIPPPEMTPSSEEVEAEEGKTEEEKTEEGEVEETGKGRKGGERDRVRDEIRADGGKDLSGEIAEDEGEVIESIPSEPDSEEDEVRDELEDQDDADESERKEEGGKISSSAVAGEDWLVLRKQYTKARIVADLKAFKREIERKRARIIRREAEERRSNPQRVSSPASNEPVAVRRQRELHEDPELVLSFPPYLSSYQRQQVHSLSESLGGLWHRSQNVGLDRQVQVRPGSPDGDNGDGDPRRLQTSTAQASPADAAGRRGRIRRFRGAGRARRRRSDAEASGWIAPGPTGARGSGAAPTHRSPLSVLQQLNSMTRPNTLESVVEFHETTQGKKAKASGGIRRSETSPPQAPAPEHKTETLDLFDPVPEGYFSFKSLGDDPDAELNSSGGAPALDSFLVQKHENGGGMPQRSRRKKKKRKKKRSSSRQQQQGQQQESVDPSVRSSPKQSSRAGSPVEQKGGDGEDEEDDDAIFAEFRPGMCARVGCKKSVKLTGSVCTFCKEIYCVTHMNAFEHGCALEAGRYARQKLAAQHGLGNRRRMDPSERARLQKKLAEKAQQLRAGPEGKKGKEKKQKKKSKKRK